MPQPYFHSVPGIGDLTREETLEEFNPPLLFTLRDKDGRLYLCQYARDGENTLEWTIAPVKPEVVLSVIENRMTIHDAFRGPGDRVCILASLDLETRRETYIPMTASELPSWCTLQQGEYLDAEPGDFDEYRKKLWQECLEALQKPQDAL